MRTAQRHNLRAAAAILSVSILGLLLSVPLCFGPGALTYLSQRAVIGVLGPSILLILNAFMLVDAVLFDATRRLALCIFLGVVTWPLAALSMSGISVAAMWKLACRYPKTVHSGEQTIAWVGIFGRFQSCLALPLRRSGRCSLLQRRLLPKARFTSSPLPTGRRHF